MLRRIPVNNREKNHFYTLIGPDGVEVKIPYTCDRCQCSAIYHNEGELLCTEHHLDKTWRKHSDRSRNNQEQRSTNTTNLGEGAKT